MGLVQDAGPALVKSLIHVEASEENDSDHYLRFHFPGTTAGTYSGDDLLGTVVIPDGSFRVVRVE